MTKFTEHLRRRILATPARLPATLLTPVLPVTDRICAFYHAERGVCFDSHGNSRMLITRASDPDELMNLSGIVAGEADAVHYTAYNGNLASLSIQRAVPITVNADGQEHVAEMVGGTVQQALEACGVELGEHDYTEPSLHTEVSQGSPSRCTGWNTAIP